MVIMRSKTELLVRIVGLLLTPVIGFLLFAVAATYDGSLFGSALIVVVPLTLYGAGFYLVLQGLSKQMDEQHSSPA